MIRPSKHYDAVTRAMTSIGKTPVEVEIFFANPDTKKHGSAYSTVLDAMLQNYVLMTEAVAIAKREDIEYQPKNAMDMQQSSRMGSNILIPYHQD